MRNFPFLCRRGKRSWVLVLFLIGFAFGTGSANESKVVPNDGAKDDHFGRAVALDGDFALIGAPFNDEAAADAGAVYVFNRQAGVWTQIQKLTPAGAGDLFGWAIAMDGQTAIIGAKGDAAGAAYVFAWDGTVWAQQKKLTPSDGNSDDEFGYSVDISGNTIIIGARNNDQ
ncbi:MAG TPA: FG-GAP repeat protein, partial [bacterium]|nr:FG-GAP repeat protein [bacterium]